MIQGSRRPRATPEARPRISPGKGHDGPRVSCPGGGGGLGLRSDPRAPGLALCQRRAGRAHGVRAEHGGALGRHLVLPSPEPAVYRRHLLLHHQRADPTRHRPLSPLYRHRSPGRVPRRPGSQRHSPVRHRHRLQFPRRAARHRGLSGIVPVRPGGLVHLEPTGGRERMEDHSPGVPAGRGVPDGHLAEFPENRAADHAQPLRRHRRHHHHLPGGLFAEPGGHGPATDA